MLPLQQELLRRLDDCCLISCCGSSHFPISNPQAQGGFAAPRSRTNFIGQQVVITKGPHRGLEGRVKRATGQDRYEVQLSAGNRMVVLESSSFKLKSGTSTGFGSGPGQSGSQQQQQASHMPYPVFTPHLGLQTPRHHGLQTPAHSGIARATPSRDVSSVDDSWLRSTPARNLAPTSSMAADDLDEMSMAAGSRQYRQASDSGSTTASTALASPPAHEYKQQPYPSKTRVQAGADKRDGVVMASNNSTYTIRFEDGVRSVPRSDVSLKPTKFRGGDRVIVINGDLYGQILQILSLYLLSLNCPSNRSLLCSCR